MVRQAQLTTINQLCQMYNCSTLLQNDRMTLYRQTPDGVPFIMSQDVPAPVNFLPNKTAVLDTIKERPA